MDEIRKMAFIINENTFLRNENNVLDSLVFYSSKKNDVLEYNLEVSNRQTEVVRDMFDECMKMDAFRQQQIKAMQEQIDAIQKQHKKEKRKNILRAGGGGVLVGIVLMLIF